MGAVTVRNLRSFDQAGTARKRRPRHRVRRSPARTRWPCGCSRTGSGARHAPSDAWKLALSRTLDHTVSNIPALDGTLVVIDVGSMQAPVSSRSRLRIEVRR